MPELPIENFPTPADPGTASVGQLKIALTSAADARPIEDATIDLSFDDSPTVYEEVRTDRDGDAFFGDLPAPPLEYSMEPSDRAPYRNYRLQITAPGYEPVIITGNQIFPVVTAIQNIQLLPAASDPNSAQEFDIPANTLYGDYPPKIIESEVKPVQDSGEIVLREVVIPEYIVVHDGAPNNASAKNYYVPYRDYIKNVACSEIYATWPEATILANVLAIQSFTLNRVYTEWYRSRGYNFTVTSSTAYDHKWIPERNLFDTISTAVDYVFTNYLSRPGVKQPILTQYCDGKKVSCPGLLSQWGSKYLGDQGYTAIEILRNYYGSNLYINTANAVSGVPESFPGAPLSIGSSGPEVRQLQEQLSTISDIYYSIPGLGIDGTYGPMTAATVSAFQEQFDLPVTGVTDEATWYKVSAIYVAVTRIAEFS